MADNVKRPADLQKSLDETKVAYHRLGKAGLKLSVPILGAMSFGHKDWQPWVVDDMAEVEKLLLAAYNRGLSMYSLLPVDWDDANDVQQAGTLPMYIATVCLRR